MVGGPSIVFTPKTVVDEIFIRDSGTVCNLLFTLTQVNRTLFYVSAHANRTIHAMGI